MPSPNSCRHSRIYEVDISMSSHCSPIGISCQSLLLPNTKMPNSNVRKWGNIKPCRCEIKLRQFKNLTVHIVWQPHTSDFVLKSIWLRVPEYAEIDNSLP